MDVLPCPTMRLNNLTVRFRGRADYRQPPDPTEALAGGRYCRPVCRRARGQGVGRAVGCWAYGARCCGCSPRMSGHTDMPRPARIPWAPGPASLVSLRPPPTPVSLGGVCSRGGGGLSGVLSGRQSGGTHIARHIAGDASILSVASSRCRWQLAAQGPSVQHSRANVEPRTPDRVLLHRLKESQRRAPR